MARPAVVEIEGEYNAKGHKKKKIKTQTIFDGEVFPLTSDNDESIAGYRK